jgi:predicted RNA-binding protein with PUA domain
MSQGFIAEVIQYESDKKEWELTLEKQCDKHLMRRLFRKTLEISS